MYAFSAARHSALGRDGVLEVEDWHVALSAVRAEATDACSALVPLITGSPAFRRDGLLEMTFDESDGPPFRRQPLLR